MKFLFTVTGLLAGLAAAAPLELETRQISQNEISFGTCSGIDIAFIWARGSTEPGNFVKHSQMLVLSSQS